jgi:hypothetical protein
MLTALLNKPYINKYVYLQLNIDCQMKMETPVVEYKRANI